MQYPMTVTLTSGSRSWCREFSQEQCRAIAGALFKATEYAREQGEVYDAKGDQETALLWDSHAALLTATRDDWIDIMHADREEG